MNIGNDKLNNEYQDIAKKNYEYYNFAHIKEPIYQIIISYALKNNSNKENFTKLLNIYTIEYLKYIIKDENIAFILFNNYINEKLKVATNLKDANKELKKFVYFLESLNYIPTSNIYKNLINENDILTTSLDIIVTSKLNIIMNGKIDEVYDNNIIVSFIEIYCILKDVNIEVNIDTFDLNKQNPLNNYLTTYSKKRLTNEEEIDLILKIQNNDKEALNKFISANILLVYSIAKRYKKNFMTIEDVMQEGLIGLMKAVNRFDITKGYRFSTYATFWIRQSIVRAIDNKERVVRLPISLLDEIKKYQRVRQKLVKELEREVSDIEVASYLHTSLKNVEKLESLREDAISINSTVSDDSNTSLEDLLDDHTNLEDNVIDKVFCNDLLRNSNLTEREKQVLDMRYGIFGSNIKTFDEIGSILNISKQVAKQIEVRAKMKIINYSKHKKIYKEEEKEDNKNLLYNKLDTLDIYELLNRYNREDIQNIIDNLDRDDKIVLSVRNGFQNNDKIMTNLWYEGYNKVFYNFVLPKVIRKLKKLYSYDINLTKKL